MIKKILSFLLFIFIWACIVWVSLSLAYTPISRQRNFVNDAANSVPITASYMDAELDSLVAASNGTLIAQGSAPSSPFEGEFWYDTTNHVLKFYRNNEWILVNPIHSGSVMATPQNNDLWINSVAGQNHLKIYGVNWSDIPAVPGLNGVNWQLPVFNGTNWQTLPVSKGINWNSLNPILLNGTNWDVPSYSPIANNYWQYQSFGNNPKWATVTIPPVTSNVLFQYAGQVEQQGSNLGEVAGTSLTPSGVTGNYRFLQSNGNGSYVQVWTTKWTKVSGVSTVTIYARIWSSSGASGQGNLKVDIGGLNSNVSSNAGENTPGWHSFSINVSSLTNGTTYDVTASLDDPNSGGNRSYCSNIMAFGS